MFSIGFGLFIFFTTAVITAAISCYHVNKTDKEAEIKLRQIELEREKIALEKGKLKAKGEFAE